MPTAELLIPPDGLHQQLELRCITAHDQDLFRQAMQIYQGSFPPEEQRSVSRLVRDLASGLERLFVGVTADQQVQAFTIVAMLPDGAALMDYLAVSNLRRGQGTGSHFVAEVLEQLRAEGVSRLFIEVEDPANGPDRMLRLRRLAFYARLGALELQGISHTLPSLTGGDAVPLRLLAIPLTASERRISGDSLRQLFGFIYQDLYGLAPTHCLLDTLLAATPPEVAMVEADTAGALMGGR